MNIYIYFTLTLGDESLIEAEKKHCFHEMLKAENMDTFKKECGVPKSTRSFFFCVVNES